MQIAKSATIRGLISKRRLKETAMTPIANGLDKFRAKKTNASHPVLGPLVDLIAANDRSFENRRDAYLLQHGDDLHPSIRDAVAGATEQRELARRIGEALKSAAGSDQESDQPLRSLVREPTEGPFKISAQAASKASRLLGKGRRELLKFQEAIADVQATHPGAPNKAMALEDAKTLRPVYVMYRGEPARRGPKVDKRFPEYFSHGDTPNRFENGSGRLELAERIVDPNNPLTARVIVNRVWRMHFGEGLVRDAGDFGLRSDTPVQRELLDWMAWSLIKNGWSLKWLHRTIMMSNTYRQASSAMHPPTRDDGTSAVEIDAANQLYWRQNRRRLDFESMRDAMLAVAGTLDTTIGGRSIKLSSEPHPTRRTVYAYVDRVEPDPIFATFDVPSPDVSSAQRTETLVPQQALFAMNNPFVTQQARAMVARPQFQSATHDAAKIEFLVQTRVATFGATRRSRIDRQVYRPRRSIDRDKDTDVELWIWSGRWTRPAVRNAQSFRRGTLFVPTRASFARTRLRDAQPRRRASGKGLRSRRHSSLDRTGGHDDSLVRNLGTKGRSGRRDPRGCENQRHRPL